MSEFLAALLGAVIGGLFDIGADFWTKKVIF